MGDFENYDVTAIIGSGSFGTCYMVRHKITHQEYVWKAVNYGQMAEENKQLLVSEVNLLSKLRHPNIVKYYDHIIHQKSATLYIIMEYCSGGDLSKVIKHCSENALHLQETLIWRILYQIALALNVCHTQCAVTVLHRDIKPANVFLDSDYNVKLGDFGLAKILGEKENFTESVVGTPLYMSPELVRNRKYDKKCDIWALGCLVYESCTLNPPFLGDNIQHLSSNIKDCKFSRKLPDYYSEDLQKMIQFLLNTDSKSRPSVDVIIRHPTVLSKTNKIIKSIYQKNLFTVSQSDPLEEDLQMKFSENLQIRLENLRNREIALRAREEKVLEKERAVIKREKKVTILERMANEKLARANLYLKRSKEIKPQPKRLIPQEDLDTSYSADPGDNSILPTSTKIDEDQIVKPKGFVRSKSERRVHFNAQRVFESNSDVVLKEYNFFDDKSSDEISGKSKKKHYFGRGIFKNLNSKVSQSSSSLGSKTSSNSDSVKPSTCVRPLSWTEENKRCAFSLLKVMNAELDKENIHSKIAHTKM